MWLYQEPFASAMAAALRLRARFVPYTYTAAMQAYETGVSLVHPLYYAYPNDDTVYDER